MAEETLPVQEASTYICNDSVLNIYLFFTVLQLRQVVQMHEALCLFSSIKKISQHKEWKSVAMHLSELINLLQSFHCTHTHTHLII